ncbi:MAG: hypothetical protein Q8N91_05565, partial [Candidatus Omnitrophota bacterium]|nr:hypothetical protein [Candidatus Omnitrophota bacterium]
DLIDYIKVVYKRRWIVLLIIISGILYGAYSEMRRPDTYEAMATFFPLDANYGMKMEGLVVKSKNNMRDLIISMLESRQMTDRIVEQLELKKAWSTSTLADARNTLKGATEIKIEVNGLMRLMVRTGSAELSSKIANAYIDNLDYLNKQLDIGAQRNIVQVIDRATAPDGKMARNAKKRAFTFGFVAFVFAVFFIIIFDFIEKVKLLERLKER